MAITENKIEEMLRNTVFTNSEHKEAVRKRLHSGIVELGKDELAMVAGGVDVRDDFNLFDNIFDDRIFDDNIDLR